MESKGGSLRVFLGKESALQATQQVYGFHVSSVLPPKDVLSTNSCGILPRVFV